MDLFKCAEEVRRQLKEDSSKIDLEPQSVENFRIKYLGKKGIIPSMFKGLALLDAESKRKLGKILNELKKEAEQIVDELNQKLSGLEFEEEFFDYTLPCVSPVLGHFHPISKTMRDICSIFMEMGFGIEFGPEVETDYYNFEALNFPENHPARDMQDTFFVEDKILLRTHTSPVQVRAMEKYEPPIRILAPGRTYRNEAISPRSYCVFHQIEGLYVDENVTFSELKTTLYTFVKRFYGEKTRLRFRPSFFPFTEPSAEVDISCVICNGSGCRVCKHTGWLEILGCGMVDPSVLETSGIDSERYTGYAFGMGLERIAMLKYGIDDIRLFFDGDIRFLEQF
jgi:phenylalanyl-tRNA synthetase alpha chain